MVLKMNSKRSILVINPNSTESMTKALEPLINRLGYQDTEHIYFTAPSGPNSINGPEDAAESAKHCLPHLQSQIAKHDAFLVACYSPHPLVRLLQDEPAVHSSRKPVTGIFEASITASLQAVRADERFGIVSTGKVWETVLAAGVQEFLGVGSGEKEASSRFAGVETTGLTAVELHETPPEEVRRRMKEATKRLVRAGRVGAICLGCAGMAGMDEMVREACVEELGENKGKAVKIVDGVVAGTGWLEGAVRAGL